MDVHPERIDSLKELPLVLKDIDFKNLRIPPLPPNLFHFEYDRTLEKNPFSYDHSKLVLADSPLATASLVSAKRLSYDQNVKESLELTFRLNNGTLEYSPGDSFGILCPNNEREVDLLLNRLSLQNVADTPTNVVFDTENSSKKKLLISIPPLLPLREIFLYCIEIRAVPKKILFRILADCTSVKEEKQSLLFLSTIEGSNYFDKLIRKPSLSILDILYHFPSCNPSAEKIIECLPPLRPRFYSAASSPLVDKEHFKILFNVLQIPKIEGREIDREGVCTGWLKKLSSNLISSSPSNLADTFSCLTLDENLKKIFLYKRKNLHFKFPDDLQVPLIMVGPGTGVAPFISYLQQREALMKSCPDVSVGETWLFYGCRYKEKDFVYKSELETFVKNGVLNNLVPSYSRDVQSSEAPKYVQDNIILYAHELIDAIKGGNILVCGEAINMAPDIQKAFIKAFEIGSGVDGAQAKLVIDSMLKEHRYVNDVWA